MDLASCFDYQDYRASGREGIIDKESHHDVPPLVQTADGLAVQLAFNHSCIPEVGRLLGVLAASVRHGVIGEIGTGCGVGAAWMVSNLAHDGRLVTVEIDEQRARAATALLGAYPNVEVLHADWHVLQAHGPFDLLFADAPAKREEPDALIQALAEGGLLVLDDFTPEVYRPVELRGQPDVVRDFYLNDPRLTATVVFTTPRTQAIVATRVA